jgi:serine/threonine protein kinase
MAEQVPDLEAVESPPRRELDYNWLVFDEDPIGGGGQGIVYRAEISDRGPPDEVAVKEPAINSGTLQEDEVEAFLEEAATWETVDRREREKLRWRDSEHIVGVVDTGDDLPWMALEYMDGGGLDERLEANSDGLPVAEALWIGERVCRGVELAHNYGIAHLDLKPANILFRETPPDVWDVPKIADWGLARVLAERTGTMEGLSVQYAAPEQFEPGEFGDPDMLTDVYQVGALVHALLTGDPPYTGSQLSVRRDVVSDERPVLPSAARESLPNVVDETVLIALETKKIDRYPTIELLKQALRAARIGEQFPSIVTQRIDIFNNEVGKSPDVETAEVSVEVVDDIIGKTYPHADRVIARHETPSSQGLQRGIITDSTRIGLTKGEGEAELAHGTWVFYVEQNGEMIGQRRHKIEHMFESDYIALAVDPHVVEAVVTDVHEWAPLRETDEIGRATRRGRVYGGV